MLLTTNQRVIVIERELIRRCDRREETMREKQLALDWDPFYFPEGKPHHGRKRSKRKLM